MKDNFAPADDVLYLSDGVCRVRDICYMRDGSWKVGIKSVIELYNGDTLCTKDTLATIMTAIGEKMGAVVKTSRG